MKRERAFTCPIGTGLLFYVLLIHTKNFLLSSFSRPWCLFVRDEEKDHSRSRKRTTNMISCPILFYLFINLLTISQVLWCSSAAASSASYQAMTRRRLVSASRTDARLTSSATATIGTSSRPGRACSFYIWNAPSALLHKWCQHVMKDHIYEGRGGVKFVRIEPGSG